MIGDRARLLWLGVLSASTAWASSLFIQALKMPDTVPTVDALEEFPPNEQGQWPMVSVIVPARNEERNLPRLLPTLLGQRYPNFEVIVVDDQSTDATPAILSEFAERDPRLRIVRGRDLPADSDWKGKPHAMMQGAEAARGEWLLFTDADTKHSIYSVPSSMSYSLAHDIDLLTITPTFELVSAAEKLIMPVAYEGISVLYSAANVNNPRSKVAIANGQYIFIKRTVYDLVGGVERVKGKIAEDLEFGKAVKGDGYRLRMADGRHLMSVRMYTNLAEVWEGWSKNVVLSLKGNPAQGILAAQGALAISIMPLVLARWTWSSWRTVKQSGKGSDRLIAVWTSALAATNIAMPFVYRARIDRLLGLSPLWTLTQPVGGMLFVLIMLSSLYRLLTGKGVTWKGRVYKEG